MNTSATSLREAETLQATEHLRSARLLKDRLRGEAGGRLERQVVELADRLAEADGQRLQELEEKERLARRLQSLVDLLPGGVIVIDGQGIVREANPVAVQLFGAPVVGQLWREIIARSFAPRKDDGHEISLRDGRRVSIATRSLNGEPGQLVLLTDLTETRLLQAQLA
nr:PAS domain-containing protein [Pseudomonas sp.]